MGNTRDTGYLRNIIAYDASNNITLPARLAVTGTVAVNNTTPYDTTQFSLDVNGGLIVKNINKTAQFVLINSNPASGGNNAFVVHTVGGTSASSYADIQGYYGTSIAGSTVIRLNPQGGNVLVGSLAGTGSRMVVADTTGVLSTQTIPTLGELSGVPTSRTLTIDGVSYDLSANRTWSVLPTGGAAGQLLAKSSATNYATEWIDNYTSEVKHYVKLAENMSIGTAVYVSGSTGQAGTNMLVSKASNASEGTSSKTLGLVAFTGVTNDIGFVVTEGLLEGLDTSTAGAVGDPVWLGVNGALIFGLANKPIAPAHLVFIGVVTRKQQNNGEIFVKVQNGFEFGELHDYVQTGVLDNYVISYESSTSLYKPKSIATLLGYTPANAARTITINGTSYDLSADRSWTINSIIYPGAGIAVSTGTAWGTSLTDNSSNWNTAYGWGNHASAGYATTTYVGTQIANLVASSPATLDTLNELAAALGNDAAFSTTVSTALGNRLRVDTASQGLSATLQGYGRTNLGLGTAATSNTGDFAAASHTHSIANVTGLQTALDGKQASGSYAAATHSHIISDVTGLQTALDSKQASLGFTPYNATNPNGYITSSGSISGNAATATNVAYSGLTGTVPTWNQNTTGSAATAGSSNFLTLQSTSNLRTITSAGIYRQEEPDSGFNYTSTLNMTSSDGRQQLTIARGGDGMKFRGSTSGSGDVSWSSWKTVWHSDNLTNLNQLTNGPGYITSAGNAATATSAGSLTGGSSSAYMLLYSALSGDLNTYNSPGLYSAEYTGSTNRPISQNGSFIQISDAGGTDVKTQWYYSSDGANIYMRLMWGDATWRAWRTLITDANIGSQSVSYATTAGSASANGGTADYAHQLKWYGAGATPTDANTFQKGILSNYYGGGSISNVPESTYGSLYNFGGYDASSLSLQLYSAVNHASTSSTRTLFFRMGNNLGFQNDWKALLDNTNYSSYALPLSGGTISGNLLLNTSAGTSPYFWLTTDQAAHYIKANGYWIDFVGNANEMFRWYNTTTLSMKIDGSNNLTVAGDVTAYSSDRRLKNNIKNIESGLQKVLSLNGVTFDWDQKAIDLGFVPTHRYNDSGVIAQEVEVVLPQAVRKAPFDDDGVGNSKSGENYLTVQYEKIVPLLIEAIKEQQGQIESQKSEIEELKDLVKQLINR